MDVRVGLWRRLSAEELMLLICGVGEDSWESFGLQGDPTSPFWRRSAWVFFGRNDAKAETLVLWPTHAKGWLIGKDSDAERDWGQEEKGMTEDEMAGWHHWLDGCESEWTPGVGDGQGGLACCSSWGRKESDITERLKWTELNWNSFHEVYSRNFIYFLDIENGLFSSIIPWIIIICINESCWFLHIDSALLYVLIASSGFTISCIVFFQIYNHYHLGVFY